MLYNDINAVPTSQIASFIRFGKSVAVYGNMDYADQLAKETGTIVVTYGEFKRMNPAFPCEKAEFPVVVFVEKGNEVNDTKNYDAGFLNGFVHIGVNS
jgi:hypothetical protein